MGEVAYWLGARAGIRHCALCEITHGTFREREKWRRLREGLGVPFAAVHLDERTPEVLAATSGREPCVIAHRGNDALDLVVDRAGLEAMGGDPDLLAIELRRRLTRSQ